jgi:hypothetical protein
MCDTNKKVFNQSLASRALRARSAPADKHQITNHKFQTNSKSQYPMFKTLVTYFSFLANLRPLISKRYGFEFGALKIGDCLGFGA